MDLEAEFHEAMLQLYDDAKALGVIATRFSNEVKARGGVNAAKHFLSRGDPWEPSQLEGVTPLLLAQGGKSNLKYTVEALVLNEKYVGLFTEEERDRACKRLKELDSSWQC